MVCPSITILFPIVSLILHERWFNFALPMMLRVSLIRANSSFLFDETIRTSTSIGSHQDVRIKIANGALLSSETCEIHMDFNGII